MTMLNPYFTAYLVDYSYIEKKNGIQIWNHHKKKIENFFLHYIITKIS